MSIPNYVRPQLTIKQLLDRTPSATISRINAIVVGPQFLLSRYGAEKTPSFAFSSTENLLPYKYKDANGVDTSIIDEVVDTTSVKLHADNLEAVLAATLNSAVTVPDLSNPSIIKSAANFAGTSGLDTNLRSRQVAIGDVFYITATDAVRRRKVVGLIGKDSAASFGTDAGKSDGKAKGSTFNAIASTATLGTVVNPVGYPLTIGSTAAFNVKENYNRGPRLNGKFGDKFTLTVIQGGVPGVSKVKVTSASGLYNSSSLTSTDGGGGLSHVFSGLEVGSLAVSITNANLLAGQVYSFEITGTWVQLPVDEVAATTLLIAGTYTGSKDTTYTLRVVETNAAAQNATGTVLRISDTAGLEPTVDVTLAANTTAQALGNYGLTVGITLSATAPTQLLVGETYYVHAVAAKASTTEFDRIQLDGPAVDTSIHTNPATTVAVKHVLPFSGEIPLGYSADASAWSATEDGVTVQAGLSLFIDERASSYKWVAFDNAIGTLDVSFRALVPPAYGESIIPIDQSSDITALLGTIDLENDLAYAASQALAGAQGQRIYALRVPADTADGFNTAFTKVESTDLTYSFAIISVNEDVKQAAKLHVLAMSQPEQKKFRRAYIGTDSPGDYLKLKYDSDSEFVLAQVTSNGTAFTLVTVDDNVNPGVNFSTLGLVAGDKLKIAGATYTIKRVIGELQLELNAGPSAGIAPAQPIEIWKTDTPESQVEFVSQVSAGLGTRRVSNVWVEDGRKIVGGLTTGSGVSTRIPCRFVAAEVAGLRSAVLPQQGLTRTEITSITEAPAMHTRYSPTLLDQAAAAGTFIITQDVESGAVFIRHQLTTETDKGSLYYEDSVGVNLDNISFGVKDLLDGYIGKYNVNRTTIAEIRNRVYQLLQSYTQADVDTPIGPALVSFDNLVVEAHPTLKDRINVSARLFMPLPLNNAEVILQGSVDLTL